MSKEETHEVWELVSVQVLSHIGTGKYVKDYFNRYHFSRVRAVRAVCGPCGPCNCVFLRVCAVRPCGPCGPSVRSVRSVRALRAVRADWYLGEM